MWEEDCWLEEWLESGVRIDMSSESSLESSRDETEAGELDRDFDLEAFLPTFLLL